MRKLGAFLLIVAVGVTAFAFAQEGKEKGKMEISPLLKPKSPEMTQTAPDVFKAKFVTSKGEFVVEVHREWAPIGADRFYNLVANGFYDGCRFFRVLDDFMAQFGINGDPMVSQLWRGERIKDDPVKQSNTRGFLSYAMAGPNSRTTQRFINYKDNSRLDGQGFAPFGKVIAGMEVVDSLYSEYGEGAPRGRGPDQSLVQGKGNAFLEEYYPKLDYIETATIITE
jgi:peptidyl-prolyl cis-trans isomerase A (cyclophilin A)